MAILDRFGRPLRSLRVSVTDRCNLRCHYCMPEPDYAWLPKDTLLSFEEIGTIADAFCDLGVERVRLTGGEPLLRRDLTTLIRSLAARPAIRDLALTTNGVLLARASGSAARRRPASDHGQPRHARSPALPRHHPLRQPRRRARRDRPQRQRPGSTPSRSIRSSCAASTTTSSSALIEYGRPLGAEVRFIEYMDVGGATRWSPGRGGVPPRDPRGARQRHYGAITPIDEESSAPADRFALPDGTIFGIISSTTEPFCDTCDRSRLTADGVWLMCLYASAGTDLRRPLRAGATPDELRHLIATVWALRADRGAEERARHRHARAIDPCQRPEERRAPRDAHKGGIKQSTVGSRVSRQSQSTVTVDSPATVASRQSYLFSVLNAK